MFLLLRVIVFILGALLVGFTLLSAIRTLVLPRAAPDAIYTTVFRFVRWIFDLRLRFTSNYRARDRILAYYAPFALLTLLMASYNRIDTIFLKQLLEDGNVQAGIFAHGFRILD